ncbi:lysophosphatidic acid receptor 6-like [Ambystoma mexicanum]|uniref:lysophosphatidic acid receptor 6-like n=1 Tax=Ambystoma mexicanum TaxID=8296 RepID=UPI0037E7736C
MMLNPSTNTTFCEPQKIPAFFPGFLSLVFFCGFILNCTSIWIFWFRIKQWNSMIILQFNLALSDAIITPAAPFIIVYHFTEDWMFGTFLCQVKVFLLSTHMYGSVYFMTLISLHRYFTVAHNVRGTVLSRDSFIKKSSLMIWGCLVLQGLPFFFTLKTSEIHGTTKCLSIHQREQAVLYFVWNWVILFSGLLIPFVITIICYTLLGRFILKMNTVNTVSKIVKSKSLQTIGVSLVIFIICYVPLHVLRTLGVTAALFLPANCTLLERIEIGYYITWVLSGTNCCLDPMLYCFASDKFYAHFINSFKWIVCRGGSPCGGAASQTEHFQNASAGYGETYRHSPYGIATEGIIGTDVACSVATSGEGPGFLSRQI